MALVQLEVLSQLEKATGRKIVDIFEWIVASGVSGFLVLAMVYGKSGMCRSVWGGEEGEVGGRVVWSEGEASVECVAG